MNIKRCIATAVVATLCFRGDAPALDAFLGHPFWVPLARLSYGAYLIHPIVLNFMVLTRATKVHLVISLLGCTRSVYKNRFFLISSLQY
jgi:peptidoglycan/LPS O-acetylase OafA/YrhL